MLSRRVRGWLVGLGPMALAGVCWGAGGVDYARDVQPILSDNCYFCHGPDSSKRKGDLRLDQLDPKVGPFAPRDGYSIVTPGKVDDSVLVLRITSDDPDTQMPPPKSHRKLTAEQVETLKRWVAEGAKWGKHWSLVAPVRPGVPEVRRKGWVRNPIDAFILARLEKERIEPSAEAPKETLIRRVTLDLTGLPPTPSEVDAFVNDTSPEVYEKVVDRLLASPRYGERMVWEWLDAARYADTNGYQGDPTRTMWPWRDWVVRAMNENMPFDQFAVWQIAGDLLPGATKEQRLASAFNRNHPFNGEGGRIPEETRVEDVMDRTDTVGTVFLGLTVGCAKCHDHKYDPISQREYYSLSAYFNQCSETGKFEYVNGGNVLPVMDLGTPEEEAKSAALKKSAHEAQATLKRAGSAEEYPLLAEDAEAAKKASKEFDATITKVMVMDDATPRETHVLVKGAYDKPAEKVEAGVPAVLNPLPKSEKNDRLALARWIVSAENPLTARVMVNRYWQQFFGVGIVKTAEDFGVQGERPVNPELLDWLAVEFRESGWDVKRMHRLMVTSAAYRQSSKVRPELLERDPANRLVARGARFRLPAVVLRDQALAASGLLVEKLGGPPVKPYQPGGIWEEATFGQIKYVQDHGEALYRRGLYTFWRRIVGPAEFFDSGSRSTCTVKPSRTNTPLHALTTLNDPTFVEAARVLAQRVIQEAGPGGTERIGAAYRFVLARKPSEKELAIWMKSLERLRSEYAGNPGEAKKLLAVGESKRDEKIDPVEHAAYTGVCLGILNLDETLSKE